jgi:hypothetical protein
MKSSRDRGSRGALDSRRYPSARCHSPSPCVRSTDFTFSICSDDVSVNGCHYFFDNFHDRNPR